MKMSRPAALAIAALGLILMVAGPLIPGGERLIHNAPPDSGHITDLAEADDGSILAGTEDGTLWRLADGRWARVEVDLGDQPVTALSADLAGDPAKDPIGTAGGLINPPAGMPALAVRVADEILAGDRLVVSSDDGLYVQGAGVWQRALEGVYVYRLDLEDGGGDDWLHAGTIDEGVFTTRAGQLLEWTPNRDGLPQGVNVFSFVLTAGDRLIAGTDQGLFWQPAPFEPWQRLAVGLEQSRMLSLLLEPRPEAEGQRLWIGSDDGLWRVGLEETEAGLEALAYAELIEPPPDHVRYGVSWIVPYDGGVLFSAGSVYYHGPTGLAGWYWVSLGGLILLLLGGWLFPGRVPEATASSPG